MVESVQRRAARFVTNSYNHCQSNKLCQHYYAVEAGLAIFRTVLGDGQNYYIRMMYPKFCTTQQQFHLTIGVLYTISTRDYLQQFHQVGAHMNAYLYSFFPSVIKLQNSLPDSVIQARDVKDEQNLLFLIALHSLLLYVCMYVSSFRPLLHHQLIILVCNYVLYTCVSYSMSRFTQ